MQDKVQGLHWNNLWCTLNPVAVYYKDGDALQSYCITSDDNKNVGMVCQVQWERNDWLETTFSYLSCVTYFSDQNFSDPSMSVQANIKTIKICTTNDISRLTTI